VRRGLGRGRSLIALGALLTIVALPLAWRTAGGIVLPVSTDWGFSGAGLLTFVAAVLMLVLMVVPYATRGRNFALDRPLVYVALTIAGVAGLVVAIVDLVAGDEQYRLAPLDAPGLWLAVAGMAITTWGVLELLAEPTQAP
jgi:hypothetical protein